MSNTSLAGMMIISTILSILNYALSSSAFELSRVNNILYVVSLILGLIYAIVNVASLYSSMNPKYYKFALYAGLPFLVF